MKRLQELVNEVAT